MTIEQILEERLVLIARGIETVTDSYTNDVVTKDTIYLARLLRDMFNVDDPYVLAVAADEC